MSFVHNISLDTQTHQHDHKKASSRGRDIKIINVLLEPKYLPAFSLSLSVPFCRLLPAGGETE